MRRKFEPLFLAVKFIIASAFPDITFGTIISVFFRNKETE
jgi:hypothetical protein